MADSIAEDVGMNANDHIMKVNGYEINDILDFRFYTAERKVEILVKRNHSDIIFDIEKDYNEDIGCEFNDIDIRLCTNKCIFCFVHQNPKNMRKALYLKDEDYRLSFLYGNYITLTNIDESDMSRIVRQKLSPLYISIHATEVDCRKKLLGIRHDDHLNKKITFLVEGGIELHAQIVVCPGINDGSILEKTIEDLAQFYPGVRSVAIVPVGLTKYRDNLFPLRLHTVSELERTIKITNRYREQFVKQLGTGLIYLTDEFFLKTDKPVPAKDYYEDFYQIENGVGEVRNTLENFNSDFTAMPESIPYPYKISWITGILAFNFIKKYIISKLKKIENLEINLIAVKNDFFGHTVSVSGLLNASDIYNQLKNLELGDLVLLPPRVLNHNNLFLDNWSLDKLESKLGVYCHVFTEDFKDLFKVIDKQQNKKYGT